MNLNSNCKAKPFGLVVRILEDVKLIGYIQFFARKGIILIKYICIEFDMFMMSKTVSARFYRSSKKRVSFQQ